VDYVTKKKDLRSGELRLPHAAGATVPKFMAGGPSVLHRLSLKAEDRSSRKTKTYPPGKT
jgi:hypothetical protein